MKQRREVTEICKELESEILGFNREELLKYTKWAIPKLYNSLKNNEKLEIKCTPELINKIKKEKIKYRIDKRIDQINIQYVELYDDIKKDDGIYIQVYLSIFFYDNVKNNFGDNYTNDRYWNDIWIVTYKESVVKKNSNCANCGAIMQYNQLKDSFECKYCGNIIQNKSDSNWEIVEIELEN